MPDLAGGIQGSAVTAFTGGRLDGDSDEGARMLDAALKVARRHAGWHVSPVKTAHTVTLDGPDSRILWLPTMKVTELTSVTEDGTALDLSTISRSTGDGDEMPRRVALRKKSSGWWSGEYGGVVVVMSHGFTPAEAPDWTQAILSMVDQMSLIPVSAATGVSSFGQSTLRVDDVQVGYGTPYIAMAEDALLSVAHMLCDYELPRVELM